MSKYADTINSFYTKSEKYTNEIVLENFGLLRRMYSNYLTTETYKHWNWSWSYMIQLAFDENKFRILVQFDNLPLTAGHLLAFKAILYKKNSQITKSSECICLKEHCWLTNNSNTLELCSMTELEEFICKDTLRLMVIVRYEEKQKTTNRLTFRPLFFFRHDWLVKSQHLESTLSDKKLSICQQKFSMISNHFRIRPKQVMFAYVYIIKPIHVIELFSVHVRIIFKNYFNRILPKKLNGKSISVRFYSMKMISIFYMHISTKLKSISITKIFFNIFNLVINFFWMISMNFAKIIFLQVNISTKRIS